MTRSPSPVRVRLNSPYGVLCLVRSAHITLTVQNGACGWITEDTGEPQVLFDELARQGIALPVPSHWLTVIPGPP